MDNNTNRPAAVTGPLAFDARTQRVLELRRQISEGSYAVDDRAVAAAMLREHFAIEPSLVASSPTVVNIVPLLRDFSRFLLTPVPRDATVLTATA